MIRRSRASIGTHARRAIGLSLATGALGLLSGPAAQASGAWTTYLHPYTYRDLLPLADTVWCASGEAGLILYRRSSGTFESIPREPGGLASNHLTALTYDRSGRLWVGTEASGVSRLNADRRTWDLVNAFDGLPVDSITVLEADGDTVWIGTPRGIALWNGREVQGRLPDGVNPSPFASDFVTGIVAQGDSLWVATHGGINLGRLSSGLSSWTRVNTGLPDTNVARLASDGTTIMAQVGGGTYRLGGGGSWSFAGGAGNTRRLVDDSGVIIASTDNGLYRWTGSAWVQVTTDPKPKPSGDGGLEIGVDRSGTFFAASVTGLYEQSAPAWLLHVPDTPVGNEYTNVLLDGPRVYATTYQEGITRFDGQRWFNWIPGANPNPSDTTFRQPQYAFTLLQDRSGRKWTGCWSAAVERFDDLSTPPNFIKYWPGAAFPDDKHTFTWASAVDSNGGVWFGMDTNGLDAQPDPICLDYYDSNGAFRANFTPGSTRLLRGLLIHGLTVDKTGRIWVGYSGTGAAGVDNFLFDPATVTIDSTSYKHVSGSDNFDVASLAARGDSIWVFTTGELRLYNRGSQLQTKAFSIAAAPALRAAHPMDVGPDGSVWVGTLGGLRVYRAGVPPEDFTTANSPLADLEVRAVRVDPVSGVVWVGTAAGLHRYDPHYRAPVPPRLPSLQIKIYPNPVLLTGMGIQLTLTGNATGYVGAVYDLSGRTVRKFTASGNGRIVWDGRDEHGALVKPGIYFVHAEGGGRSATARVALIR